MAQKDSSTLIRFDEGEIQEFLGRTIKEALREARAERKQKLAEMAGQG